jgi:hypothetical protein
LRKGEDRLSIKPARPLDSLIEIKFSPLCTGPADAFERHFRSCAMACLSFGGQRLSERNLDLS